MSDLLSETVPRVEDVSASWLQQALIKRNIFAKIGSIQWQRVGTGQLGDTYRLFIEYISGSGPKTIIGKFPAESADSREIATEWNLYRREIGFYRYLASRAGISTPACYCAEIDNEQRFILLLEDLAPAAAGDQIAGLNLAQAATALSEVARLHAATWGIDGDKDQQWLDAGRVAQPFYSSQTIRSAWPLFYDRYSDLLTTDMIRVCEGLADGYPAYIAPLSHPRCVTHNDYRPDNFLFKSDTDLKVVDWQSCAFGYSGIDVAFLLGGAFVPEDRRAVETGLLKTYHRELVRAGVDSYSLDMLINDYRHFSFAGINVAVGAAVLVKRTERGDRMFLTMLQRHVSHVLDTGAIDIVQRVP